MVYDSRRIRVTRNFCPACGRSRQNSTSKKRLTSVGQLRRKKNTEVLHELRHSHSSLLISISNGWGVTVKVAIDDASCCLAGNRTFVQGWTRERTNLPAQSFCCCSNVQKNKCCITWCRSTEFLYLCPRSEDWCKGTYYIVDPCNSYASYAQFFVSLVRYLFSCFVRPKFDFIC